MLSSIAKFITFLAFFLILGCAKNPVTGQHELHLVSTKKEIDMGEQHYTLGQQMGGGQYVVHPEITTYVQEVGHKLAQLSDRPYLPFEFVVLNDSIPNAWAMPGGKIAINRGLLLHLHNEAELAAVLGHEITHATARHSAKAMERQIVLGTTLLAANIALSTQHPDKDLQNSAIMASAAMASTLLNTKYSRSAELEADAYGMQTMVKAGYDPYAAVTLQETFVQLFDKKSPHWLEGLFASHPPSRDRVKANAARAQTLPSSLTLGKERYESKMALLKKEAPAYEHYKNGLEALKKKNFVQAESFANQAISLVPQEALFLALKGDALTEQGKHSAALVCYNQAISFDNKYFYYYHQRGLLHEKMGHSELAKADLTQSQKRLPTEQAQQALQRLVSAN